MSEHDDAILLFQEAARAYVRDPSPGTRYALEVAAVSCQILGIDPSTIEAPPGGKR